MYSEFLAGTCPANLVRLAFEKLDQDQDLQYEQVLKRNSRAKRPDRETHVDVVFSPFSLQVRSERNGAPINVLFGRAKADRQGQLSPADVESELPTVWVGRPSLSPSDGLEDDAFPLADADAYYDVIEGRRHALETWPA
ncbi:MAG: hypothetical protein ABSD03_14710, partial [Vulcanimicrobiaceae bacterium]